MDAQAFTVLIRTAPAASPAAKPAFGHPSGLSTTRAASFARRFPPLRTGRGMNDGTADRHTPAHRERCRRSGNPNRQRKHTRATGQHHRGFALVQAEVQAAARPCARSRNSLIGQPSVRSEASSRCSSRAHRFRSAARPSRVCQDRFQARHEACRHRSRA